MTERGRPAGRRTYGPGSVSEPVSDALPGAPFGGVDLLVDPYIEPGRAFIASKPLTAADLFAAIEDLWATPPAPQPLIVHPRTLYGLRRWERWQRHVAAMVAPAWLPPWPRWLRVYLGGRRRRVVDRRFGRWLRRYPYRPRIVSVIGL